MRYYDIFQVHARINQSVKLGEELKEFISHPVYDKQRELSRGIYVSSNKNSVVVTDPECSRIGKFIVPIPDTSLGRLREFGTTFLFGGTEIEVKVVDKATGKVTKRTVDFLG
jgi:hypothetical protein